MLIPIGLDETRVARLPWVSIVLLALNVVVFVATSTSDGEAVTRSRFQAVVTYWRDHPYLEVPADVERRFGLTAQRLTRLTGRVAQPQPQGADAVRARFEVLCEELVQAYEDTPERRWSLVPARGAGQPGWLTHQFLHGGLGHLLGNMLVFALVVAPFLEDVWGRPFFLAFYLTGGVVAGLAQALPMGDSPIHILGASGAISACLGAFAVRFAHRRVRMFYWVALLFRGTFLVPAWLYAFLGLAGDLLGLKLAGTGGGVAYAAHVGGFLFGLGVALVMRWTGLEARLAPEGAARWGRTLSASRASDALADGRVHDARRHLEEAVAKDPQDLGSALDLARLHARAFDRTAATPIAERLVTAHLARGDAAAARAVLAELDRGIDPALFRPATAYRAAELVDDPAVADAFDAVAAGGGGALAAKALLRSAERAREPEPSRARTLAARARDADGAPAELRARAEALLAGLPPDPAAAPAASRWAAIEMPEAPGSQALPQEAPVRLVHCRLLAVSEAGLDLATEQGRRAVLPPDRVEALASAVVAEHDLGGRTVKNAVLLDLLLHPRPGDAHRTMLRLPGHEMALGAIHPGVPPPEAFARVVEALLAASGARASPSPAAASGRPFARFGDAAAFEAAAWGRALA